MRQMYVGYSCRTQICLKFSSFVEKLKSYHVKGHVKLVMQSSFKTEDWQK